MSSTAVAPPTAEGPLPSIDATAGSERLPLLDALRGFALAGVLLVNLGAFSLYIYLSPAQRAELPTAGFDFWARVVVTGLAFGKFLTLFSLLFGLGFAVQLMRAESRGGDALALYKRRLLVLLAIGLAHALFLWWGDVLRYYAILGFVLLLFRRASSRAVLWTGLALSCTGAAILGLVLGPLLQPLLSQLPSWTAAGARAFPAFSGDSYAAVVAMNPWFDAYYLAVNSV